MNRRGQLLGLGYDRVGGAQVDKHECNEHQGCFKNAATIGVLGEPGAWHLPVAAAGWHSW